MTHRRKKRLCKASTHLSFLNYFLQLFSNKHKILWPQNYQKSYHSQTVSLLTDRFDGRHAWLLHRYVLHCGRDTNGGSFDYNTYGVCKTTTWRRWRNAILRRKASGFRKSYSGLSLDIVLSKNITEEAAEWVIDDHSYLNEFSLPQHFRISIYSILQCRCYNNSHLRNK